MVRYGVLRVRRSDYQELPPAKWMVRAASTSPAPRRPLNSHAIILRGCSVAKPDRLRRGTSKSPARRCSADRLAPLAAHAPARGAYHRRAATLAVRWSDLAWPWSGIATGRSISAPPNPSESFVPAPSHPIAIAFSLTLLHEAPDTHSDYGDERGRRRNCDDNPRFQDIYS